MVRSLTKPSPALTRIAATMEVIEMKTIRRFLIGVLGAVLVLFSLAGIVSAGTEATSRQQEMLWRGDAYYWMISEQERLGLCVFVDTEAEAGFRLQIAQELLNQATQHMEQSRFAEANAALVQYRVQIQAMNRAMISIRERAASQDTERTDPGKGQLNGKTTIRTDWLDPGEIINRVEQMTQAQLRVLNQLCNEAQGEVCVQTRMALEECTRTCTREQAGMNGSEASNSNSNDNKANQRNQARDQNQVQEPNQVREQNQVQDQNRTQEQNQTQEQQQGPTNTEPERKTPNNQPPAPGPDEPKPRQGK